MKLSRGVKHVVTRANDQETLVRISSVAWSSFSPSEFTDVWPISTFTLAVHPTPPTPLHRHTYLHPFHIPTLTLEYIRFSALFQGTGWCKVVVGKRFPFYISFHVLPQQVGKHFSSRWHLCTWKVHNYALHPVYQKLSLIHI